MSSIMDEAGAVRVSGSLRNRLAVTLIGGAAVFSVLLFFVVRSYATQIAQQGQDQILGASVTSILEAAAIRDGTVEIDFPYAAFSMLGTASDDRIFYAIYRDGALLSGYGALPFAPETPDARTVAFKDTMVRVVNDSRVLIGADQRSRIDVAVAQTQDVLAGRLREISRNVALAGAGFFALAVLLSFWTTASTIGPLRRLTDSVTRRGPQDLSPVVKPVPSEMGPLVGSLNRLMGRLEQSLSQSEDFIAEAAHRVRTPLATVRSHGDVVFQRVEREENRQALRAMMRAVDESSRAAGQLLDHAMITFRAGQLERQPLDLGELVQELVRGLRPVAEMRDVDLRVIGMRRVEVSGDPILLQNAVRNLIDNALKYSPIESVIEIEIGEGPPSVVVRDQGPGFPPDQIDSLTNRFSRGTNVGGTIGSGLGLTIARDVAVAHGGRLQLSNLAEGGACVTLSL